MAIYKYTLVSFFVLGLSLTNCSDSSFSGSTDSSKSTTQNSGTGNDANPDLSNDQFGDGSGEGNNLGNSNGDNGDGSSGTLDVGTGSATVPVNITFQRFPDSAFYNNCISIAVGSDTAVEVGCNKDATLTRATMVQFKPKPACNKISISLKIAGASSASFSTANSVNVRLANSPEPSVAGFTGFMFYKASNDQLKGLVNDNGDNKAHSDTTFTLSGLSTINYYIENIASDCN